MEKQAMEKGRDERNKNQKGTGETRQEREKKKGREEWDTIATGHQFFKVFFPEQSGERLKIPPTFQEYLEEEPNKEVSLKGPSGNIWKVVLTSDSQGLSFTKGWKSFAHDHSLTPGQFLVFTYDGCSQFSVVVFCAMAVEDKSALNVRPFEAVVIRPNEEEVVDIASSSEEPTLPPMEGNGTIGKKVRQATNEMENCTDRKRLSGVRKNHEKKKLKAMMGISKEAPTEINNDKVRSKKSREPLVISQRRPVTEEEKNNALNRAKKFKSKNPFVVQVMMESYVYVGFFLKIPCQFVREFLPRTSKKMTLWDPQGKSWEVNYIYNNNRAAASFSGGWLKFALGNNLEKFDVCVFELFKEDNIKVHIYRVVPEITLPLRKSSM